ncbi:MAG TPA: DUF4091 domain-containing protein, partial [Bacteroidetes bacterium]|nr:DUF4091 domain-containing protein [Bacteroidota bacterium]
RGVELRRVEYVPVETPSDAYGSQGHWPDPLPPLKEALQLRPGQNVPMWVAISAPRSQTPGLYRGEIEILQGSRRVAGVPLVVRVLDFTLPAEPTVETAYGVSPERRYFGPVSDAQFRRIHDLTMQLCARYRISPYYPHRGANFRYTFEGDPPRAVLDFSAFDSAMTRYLDGLHFTTFNVGGLPAELDGHKRGTPEYERLFRDVFGRVQEHLRERGWLRKAYWYWVDEPPISQYDDVKKGMALLKRACPDIRRLLTCNQEDAPVPEFYGLVNLWVPILDRYNPDLAHARQKLGETVWWYVCTGPKAPYPNNFIDHPAVNHRIRFWMLDRYGVDGSLYWSITYWRQSPWEQAMSVSPSGGNWGNGDGRLLYPPRRTIPNEPVVEAPVPSIRLECLRDGLEDVELLHALRRSGDAESLQLVQRAENALVPTLTCFEQNPALLQGWRLVVGRVAETVR